MFEKVKNTYFVFFCSFEWKFVARMEETEAYSQRLQDDIPEVKKAFP